MEKNHFLLNEEHSINSSRIITVSAIMGVLAFFILLSGPVIKSISFGFPGGFFVLPAYSAFLLTLRKINPRITFFSGLVSGSLASFFPFFGGIGPFSILMGVFSGTALILLPSPENKFIFFQNSLIVSLALFAVVLWQFQLFHKIFLIFTIFIIQILFTVFFTFLFTDKRIEKIIITHKFS